MVFLFLCIMIVWIVLSSKISARFEHLLPEPQAAPVRRPAAAPAAAGNSGPVAAVIAAAIHRYRAERGPK